MTPVEKVNGTAKPSAPPIVGDWRPIETTGIATVWAKEKQPAVTSGTPAPPEVPAPTPAPAPAVAVDPVAEAEAEAIRIAAAAEADAIRRAAEIKAVEEARKQKIANDRAEGKATEEQAEREARIAKKKKEEEAAKRADEKAQKEAEEQAAQEAARAKEQERTENLWKWGARGIYAVGLIIAAPVQFLAFWDKKRPFLVAAPALLEGLALVLAFGAAWAVAHRRDVAPYRIGIMIGALIAAGINLWHGLTDPKIGLNAGLIGALASIGGPIVLMAYEHGIAQKADGIPSYRERRAAKKKAEAEAKEKARLKAEKDADAAKAAKEKAAKEEAAEAEQKRRDDDRQQHHQEVWDLADSLRAARGEATVTNQIFADAWYLKTGSKRVGITADIEAGARAAQARMKTATETSIIGEFSLIESQKGPRAKRDPDAPDGRRFNGGVPPVRTVGDTEPYSEGAKKQAAIEQTETAAGSTSG